MSYSYDSWMRGFKHNVFGNAWLGLLFLGIFALLDWIGVVEIW